jgi:hypothetical protein
MKVDYHARADERHARGSAGNLLASKDPVRDHKEALK